jgi:hypothetical protein
MRAILDQDEEEVFLELIVDLNDLVKIREYKGSLLRLPYGIHGKKTLNIFIRKDRRSDGYAIG